MSADGFEAVQLEVIRGSQEDVEIVRVKGPLTIRNFFEFQETARRTVRNTIIDLGGVPYLDSAALGVLVGLHVSCEKNKRKYALVNIPDRIRVMFDMTRISEFLVIYPTIEEAERELTAGSK